MRDLVRAQLGGKLPTSFGQVFDALWYSLTLKIQFRELVRELQPT